MAWFYEIRDSTDSFVAKGEGFATQEAALTAGKVEAARLKATGNMPGGGVGTVTTGQDASEPWQ
jgi:hypothetical protein